MLEAPSWEPFENYLGVAPIRSGGRRYRQNEAGCRWKSSDANKGGTARFIQSRPFLHKA